MIMLSHDFKSFTQNRVDSYSLQVRLVRKIWYKNAWHDQGFWY